MSESHRSEAQLQRLRSSLQELRARARPSLARASDRLSQALTQQVVSLVSSLADPDFLRWGSSLTHSAATVYDRVGPIALKLVSAAAVTGVLRKLTERGVPARREPGPVLPAQPPAAPYRCDRALVEQMLL